MKKILALLILLCVVSLLCSCGVQNDTGEKENNVSSSTSSHIHEKQKSQTQLTTQEYINQMAKVINISDISEKMGSMIGAEEKGTAFEYNDKSFELYLFSNGSEEPDKAKSGTNKFNIKGLSDFTMKSSVNGNYVLLYNNDDETVINTFMSIKY